MANYAEFRKEAIALFGKHEKYSVIFFEEGESYARFYAELEYSKSLGSFTSNDDQYDIWVFESQNKECLQLYWDYSEKFKLLKKLG